MTIIELKNIKKETIRLMCYAELEKTDWKVIRHSEQKILGLTTTLSDTEFSELSILRQKIKNKYHTLVSDVDDAIDEQSIQSIKWNME